MLSRGEVALLNGALLGEALGSLEEKFRAVAAAKAADGSGITCHFLAPDSGDDRFTRLPCRALHVPIQLSRTGRKPTPQRRDVGSPVKEKIKRGGAWAD